MPKFVRVRNKETGHKFSVAETAVDKDTHERLKEPATDRNGRLLPPEHKTTAKKAASASTPTNTDNKE